MAWSQKFKLNKQLLNKLDSIGYIAPTEIQQKTLARIYGGQDVVAIAPKGSGKTTTYVLAVSNRMGYSAEGVPRVLILVPSKEDVLAVIQSFEELNKNKTLLITGLYAAPGIETQMNALADGADIVVATPERARAIYLKLGLNLNKIELFIIDDADEIVKQGTQLPVTELANSITKAQRLVFTEVMHPKLQKMISPFMEKAAVVETEEITASKIATWPQVLYHVPNFGTKLNLLSLFMQDEELFTKTIIFVNTRQTAEKVYKTLQNKHQTTAALFNSWSVEYKGFESIEDFKGSDARVLIAYDNEVDLAELGSVPFLIHFELPAEKEIFIDRIIRPSAEIEEETLAITFATDLELTLVKRIEQLTGKIPVGELPVELVIYQEKKNIITEEAKPAKNKVTVPIAGEAFHQKKPENAKTYNYSSGQKAKMNNKKKHG